MTWGSCAVCVLVHNDPTPKLVAYCHTCDAWLCDRCRRDPLARALAAFKRWLAERGA